MFFSKIPIVARTIISLGIGNCLVVLWYKSSLWLGLRKLLKASPSIISQLTILTQGTNLRWSEFQDPTIIEEANAIITGRFNFFHAHNFQLGSPPNWFLNPFNGSALYPPFRHWSAVADFVSGIGDIKSIWECSRFSWILILTRAFLLTHDVKYLVSVNQLLNNWIENNPVDRGPQWKCGQEVAIRANHVILAWHLLGNTHISEALRTFLEAHASRISHHISYSLAQSNNHGTSEASALYLIGLVLSQSVGAPNRKYRVWMDKGRKLTEMLVRRLVMMDGSFAQHSTVYHRLFLDTVTYIEYFRKKYQQIAFSEEYYLRVSSAITWLYAFTQEGSGDTPNLGANDGSAIYCLHTCGYRDFRPSVQLASVLFRNNRLFGRGEWDRPLELLGLKANTMEVSRYQGIFPDGGYGILRRENIALFFRGPVYRFRPSHADPLHIDLWLGDNSILIDSGSYSYNDPDKTGEYLASAAAHNTIVFDSADPMPRLGRFLFGNWLRGTITGGEDWLCGGYHDFRGFSHERNIKIIGKEIKIVDRISGEFKHAELSWHLGRQDWKETSSGVSCSLVSISVEGKIIEEYKTGIAMTSPCYHQLVSGLKLTVKLRSSGEVVTTITFA
jgi:hypothetical protein